jgi:NAD(P)-dependent dehydrogenase (short-subunit alcohol dehydrogenase family)
MDLSGTVTVVTGAGGGLGGGISRAFAAAGAAVVVHYRNSADSTARVVADITTKSGRAVQAQCDITDPDGCRGLMATAVDAFGRVDTVVANAGVQPGRRARHDVDAAVARGGGHQPDRELRDGSGRRIGNR